MTTPRSDDDRSRETGFRSLTAAFTELERRADAVPEPERTAHPSSPDGDIEHPRSLPRPSTDSWMRRFAPLAAAAAVVLALGGVGTWWASGPPSSTSLNDTSGATGLKTVDAPSQPPASSVTGTAACRNVAVPAQVRLDLRRVDGRVDADAVSGATFYGTCGTTSFAVVRYQLFSAYTAKQDPAFQGAGAYPELFVNHGDGWVLTAHASKAEGCTDSADLPAALRTLWNNCTPSTAPTPCEQYSATHHLIRPTAVTVKADGSATITGNVVTRHCGGLNNVHYTVSSTLSAPVNLHAGAPVTVLGNGVTPVALDVGKLAKYEVDNHGAINFVITGTLTAAGFDATGLAQPYHP